MGFNKDKCKVMHVGKNNPHLEYTMNDAVLGTVKEEKDLGILISDTLTFSSHIGKIAAKANSVLGIIRRTFSYFSTESFLILYKAYVRPQLEYCVQAWAPYLKKDKTILEKVQRRATKLVPEIANLPQRERLRKLKITTLEERRDRGDLIEVYKIMNGLEAIDYNEFFQFRKYPGLRGHPYTLEVKRCKYNIRKYFFSNRVICLWNSLPSHIVSAPNVNSFKNLYDNYYFGM